MSPKLLNILLVLIPVVMYYGLFLPMYTGDPGLVLTPETSIRGLQTKNVQYINAINLVSVATLGVKKINDDYKSISTTTIQKVELMLPDKIDKLKLRNEVTAIAEKAGVGISGVSVIPDVRNTNVDTEAYLVSFSAKGRYSVIKTLIEEYEKNMRFYTIDSLKISKQDPKGLTGQELFSFDKDSLVANFVYKVSYLK